MFPLTIYVNADLYGQDSFNILYVNQDICGTNIIGTDLIKNGSITVINSH